MEDPIYRVRLSSQMVARIDDWTAISPDVNGRSEAIRKLIDLGLGAPKRANRTGRRDRRALEMAGSEVDRVEDVSATEAEQLSRKRTLLKGPEEFRKIRVDHSKEE